MPLAAPGPCLHQSSPTRATAPQSRSLWRCQRADAVPELSGFSLTLQLPPADHSRSVAQAEMPPCHQPAENHPLLPGRATATAPREPSPLPAHPKASPARSSRQMQAGGNGTSLPPREESLVAKLPGASTVAGSWGQGHVSAGNGSSVPSLSGDCHTATQPLRASTATPARRLPGTPKLGPHPAQSTGSPRQRGTSGTKGAARTDPRTRIQRKPGSPWARHRTATSTPPRHHPPLAAPCARAEPGRVGVR